MPISRLADDSVLASDGRVLHFSVERFLRDIVLGDCCFICGASPSTVEFNNEHVLPRWLLKKYKLYDIAIKLPNLSSHSYGNYVLPCCVRCNSYMNTQIEVPIQEILAGGVEGVSRHVRTQGPHLLFNWLALLFIKTHLKDKFLRNVRDERAGDSRSIAEAFHDPVALHHVHCVARAFYTEALMDKTAIGSILVLRAKIRDHFSPFDYVDLHIPQSMLIRMDDVCIIAVLNDSCAVVNLFFEDVKRIEGRLSPVQAREVLAHVAYINTHLLERPRFLSEFDELGPQRLLAQVPAQAVLDENDEPPFREFLTRVCGPLFEDAPYYPTMIEHMRQGRMGFLFDRHGKFQFDSMDFKGDENE